MSWAYNWSKAFKKITIDSFLGPDQLGKTHSDTRPFETSVLAKIFTHSVFLYTQGQSLNCVILRQNSWLLQNEENWFAETRFKFWFKVSFWQDRRLPENLLFKKAEAKFWASASFFKTCGGFENVESSKSQSHPVHSRKKPVWTGFWIIPEKRLVQHWT